MATRNVLVCLLVLLAGAGCERLRSARTPTRPAEPAEPPLTQEQAGEKVWELPEVMQWSEWVRRQSGALPVCRMDTEPGEKGRPAFYVFGMTEVRRGEEVLWARFRVNPAGGAITVWDPVTESYLPLDVWRIKAGYE